MAFTDTTPGVVRNALDQLRAYGGAQPIQTPDAQDRNAPAPSPIPVTQVSLPPGFNPRAAPVQAQPLDLAGAREFLANLTTNNPMFQTPNLPNQDVTNAIGNVPVVGGLANYFGNAYSRGPLGTAQGLNPDFNAISAMPEGPAKQQAIQDFTFSQSANAAIGAAGPLERVGGYPAGSLGARMFSRSGEQQAASAGQVSAEQAANADNLAREVAAREAAAPPPPPPPYTPPTPPPPDHPLPENLGVNIDKIDAPQATKDLITETAIQNNGFEAQRRGVVSIDETMAAATNLQNDALKYANLKPGTALNAEQLTALKGALVSKGNEVVDLQNTVRDARAIGVNSDEMNLRLILASTEHQQLQRAFAGVRAESGRALRIQQEITGALAEGTGTAYDRAIQAIGGRENAKALVDRLQKVWTDPTLDQSARELATYKFIQNLDRPSFFDHINSFWINSILSSPVTHAVNVTGQTALQIADMASKVASAGIESVITVGGKTRPRERFFSEALVSPFGAVSGLGDGFRRGLAMLRNGVSPESMTKFLESGKTSRAEVNPGILNIPTRALGAEDQVFYAVGYSRGIWESAARTAAKERRGILSGDFGKRVAELVQNPTPEMMSYADTLGKRAGLRTEAGTISSQIIRMRDVNVLPSAVSDFTIGGKAIGQFQPLRYVVPFVNTPVQLVKIGAEYSPFGLLKLVTAKGAERSDILARSLLGSTAMGFLVTQYANGLITGAAPTDPAARDAFYRDGKIPYSVKIGNEWVSFSRIEPVATPLKWTALLLDAAQGNQGQPVDVIASKMVAALSKSLTDATYLSGFSALIDAVNDPERSASKFFSQIIGGFVPAAVRAGVQSNDPFIRNPNGLIEQIESTLPGLNEKVAPRLTVYGEPATRTQGKQGLSGIISPIDFNAAQANPVDQKIAQYSLPELVGPDGRPIPVRDLQVGFVSQDIANYKLTPQEGFNFQQYAGRATYQMLDALFNDQRPYNGQKFSTLGPADQIRAIRAAVDDARSVGRAQVADEIVHAASDPTAVSRGAAMRLSTIDKMRDRAIYVEGLQATGKLTPQVRAYLDSHKAATEPTVADQLSAAPLVRQYLATPPYNIGNPQEWAQLSDAKDTMTAFLKKNPAPPGWTELDWFQSKNPQLGTLIRRYSYTQVRNYQRAVLLKQHPEIQRYLSGTTDIQQSRFTTP